MQYPQQGTKESKAHLDLHLFKVLCYLNVVASQYEFSRMMGRNPSYFSSLQCKHLPVSAAALVRLYRRISALIAKEADPCRHGLLTNLQTYLETEINQRLQ